MPAMSKDRNMLLKNSNISAPDIPENDTEYVFIQHQ